MSIQPSLSRYIHIFSVLDLVACRMPLQRDPSQITTKGHSHNFKKLNINTDNRCIPDFTAHCYVADINCRTIRMRIVVLTKALILIVILHSLDSADEIRQY